MNMNMKTMEGLAGASTSISMISTPMNVVKEAERKGDTDKMKRALGYAAGLKDQAEEYNEKTSQGMKLEAKEAKEQEKLNQEKLIQARREEREELEKRIQEEQGNTHPAPAGSVDSAEISEEGKMLAEQSGQEPINQTGDIPDVTYDKSGNAEETAAETGEAINVSV